MKISTIQLLDVEYIPDVLEDGILYVSEKFKTASHLCCCGCGTKIVTPLRNTEFTLTRHGNFFSLYPSIGNWNHPCQSHYWIKNNRIISAPPMSKAEILGGRAHDDKLKSIYFSKTQPSFWRQCVDVLRHWVRQLFK